MANINEKDRDNMISAVIHLANKDYASLVDDFIHLGILPVNSDRAAIIPLMDKALSPYVKGGGAKKYEEELKKIYGMEDGSNMQSQVGGFQAMTQGRLCIVWLGAVLDGQSRTGSSCHFFSAPLQMP